MKLGHENINNVLGSRYNIYINISNCDQQGVITISIHITITITSYKSAITIRGHLSFQILTIKGGSIYRPSRTKKQFLQFLSKSQNNGRVDTWMTTTAVFPHFHLSCKFSIEIYKNI